MSRAPTLTRDHIGVMALCNRGSNQLLGPVLLLVVLRVK